MIGSVGNNSCRARGAFPISFLRHDYPARKWFYCCRASSYQKEIMPERARARKTRLWKWISRSWCWEKAAASLCLENLSPRELWRGGVYVCASVLLITISGRRRKENSDCRECGEPKYFSASPLTRVVNVANFLLSDGEFLTRHGLGLHPTTKS